MLYGSGTESSGEQDGHSGLLSKSRGYDHADPIDVPKILAVDEIGHRRRSVP